VLWSIGVTALLFSSIGTTMLLVYMDYFDSHTSEELRKSLTMLDDEELGTLVPSGPSTTAADRGEESAAAAVLADRSHDDGATQKRKEGEVRPFDGVSAVVVKGSSVAPVRSPFSQVSYFAQVIKSKSLIQ
jgi:hypothetical protein